MVSTRLGKIAVEERRSAASCEPTLVFLHGVFLDRTLWAELDDRFASCRRLYVDMPAHGASDNVGRSWNLEDCVAVLDEVLSAFDVDRCMLVGHSWGAMVALRFADAQQARVSALALFNMPHQRIVGVSRIAFHMQKAITRFQRFYARQAAKSLMGDGLLRRRPELVHAIEDGLAKRSHQEINFAIDAVLLNPESVQYLLESLDVPTLIVVGEEDYVGLPNVSPSGTVELRTVPGGHVTPYEAPEETVKAIDNIIERSIATQFD